MDPHGDKLPGLDLPPLSLGQESLPSLPETRDAGIELPSIAPVAAVAATPIPAMVAPTPHPAQAVAQAVPIAPVAADDGSDALDEEWVNKAKAIVEKTKSDPYIESSELSKVKAEYMNIRYNKHIKVAENHS